MQSVRDNSGYRPERNERMARPQATPTKMEGNADKARDIFNSITFISLICTV